MFGPIRTFMLLLTLALGTYLGLMIERSVFRQALTGFAAILILNCNSQISTANWCVRITNE